MPVTLTRELLDRLQAARVATALKPGARWPDEVSCEAPVSLRRTEIAYSLSMGAFSYVAGGFLGACTIGRYCSLAEDVQVGRQAHLIDWVSSSPVFTQPDWAFIFDSPPPEGVELVPRRDFKAAPTGRRLKTTEIGHDVWIGHGAFVLPGVRIGTGAVVAAMSVVTRDVPPYAIVAGSPAEVKRHRFEPAQVEALLDSRWWEYAPWQLRGMQVDDPLVFARQVRELRARGEPPYAPAPVRLADLAGAAPPDEGSARRWWMPGRAVR